MSFPFVKSIFVGQNHDLTTGMYCTLISPSRVHFFSDQSQGREEKRLSCRPPRRRAGFGGCGVVGLGAFIHGLPERGEFPLARARAPAEWMVQTPPRRGTGLKEGSGRGHLIHARPQNLIASNYWAGGDFFWRGNLLQQIASNYGASKDFFWRGNMQCLKPFSLSAFVLR